MFQSQTSRFNNGNENEMLLKEGDGFGLNLKKMMKQLYVALIKGKSWFLFHKGNIFDTPKIFFN